MATKKSTNKSSSKTKRSQTDTTAESVTDADVSGAWTVVEETIVDNDMNDNNAEKENSVVHIENVEVNEETPRAVLYRNPNDKILGGVCSGLANTLGWDPTIVRVLWVGASIATFFMAGAITYLAFWALLPAGTPQGGVVEPAKLSFNKRNSNVIPYALMGVGGLVLLSNIGLLGGLVGGLWKILSIAFWPAVIIGIGYKLLDAGSKANLRTSVKEARSNMNMKFASDFTNKVDGKAVRNRFSQVRSNMPLRRSASDRVMMGLCGGLAHKVGIDANLIRFGWVILTLMSGFLPGIVAYVVISLLLPEEGVMNTTRTREPRQKVQDVQIL